MADAGAALYRLMAWLSPSYPVGAFSYSHGIEHLVEDGAIRDLATLVPWLDDLVALGSGRSDAVLFACAWRAAAAGDLPALDRIADHGLALASGAERLLETAGQGDAFVAVTVPTWQAATLARLAAGRGDPVPYPIAVATACADHGVALAPALAAFVHAFAANLISAAVRLVPLGHSDGQRALRAAEGAVGQAVADGLAARDVAEAGGITVAAELAAMLHETQYTRLFRT